jgi:ATP-dependent RNA helicase RhlE
MNRRTGVEPIEGNVLNRPHSFVDLPLSAAVQKGVAETGYTAPTPIQAAAIGPLLEGRDLLGCAQTGTGKTAAFALPILHRLDADRRRAVPHAPRVLVLSPTRELAMQIGESFAVYGRFVAARCAVIFGGVGQNPQVRALARGAHVVVATPGRLLDLMNQGHVRLDGLDTFVLDEADRMLDMGFLPDIRRITAALPERRQSLFFSATMPETIAKLADSLLRDPVRVEVAPASSTVETIEQRVLPCGPTEKPEVLRELLRDESMQRVLVFTRTKRRADVVAKKLRQAGVESDAIHGNKSQNARTRALDKFRAGHTRVLVATDVAARGLDVDDVSHVVNYDLPHEPESYVHRIGRTGRAGASGVAVTFCEPGERNRLRAIERLIRQQIPVASGGTMHAIRHATPPAQSTASTPARPAAEETSTTQGARRRRPKDRSKDRPQDGPKDRSRRPRRRRQRTGV